MSDTKTEIVIECNDSLDVSMVADFKEMLKQAIGQNLPVVLDAAALERVDCAAMQLFAAYFLEGRSSGVSIAWRSPSEPLRRAAALGGFQEIMEL